MATRRKTSACPHESRREAVSFATMHGITLAGHLYPARDRTCEPVSALVMSGPMTSVKGEAVPHYAAVMAVQAGGARRPVS
jgi:hypothetical protein